MSPKAHAENTRGDRELLDAVSPVRSSYEAETSDVDLTGGEMPDHISRPAGADDGAEKRANDEFAARQLEEEDTLPPIPSVTANENDIITNASEISSNPSPNGAPSPGSPTFSSFSSTPASKPISKLRNASPMAVFDRRLRPRVFSSNSVVLDVSPSSSTDHSRQMSFASQVSAAPNEPDEESQVARGRPWEVIRWSKLKKISNQTFSEAAKRAFGRPTFLTIGAYIAVGTSKGIVLLFDYQQSLKSIFGQGTEAVESGAVLALAISADHSTIAAGHANGSIFTWELAQPARPFLHVPPVNRSLPASRKSDGHVMNSAILHIGFLGHRHTALVSADSSGMAFSHLASRGLGSLGRNVNSTRILGKYPDMSKSQRPTSVLAFAPLPLGNVDQTTDNMGLTAILTPYLLVIVSTTPMAQTHFKLPRVRDAASHDALTGCLAWFPAVKLRETSSEPQPLSKTKLVYCWSNVLSLLEVEAIEEVANPESTKTPDLTFKSRGSWKSEEAILAVQWMSRSIIAVLTITQRLVILTDNPLRVTDASDLNSKQMYHQDIFSEQLLPVVDKIGQGDSSMHGVVPDAYYMSFKAYKSRLFVLGTNDVSLGTLSNWADRLMSLMEAGNPVSAIELATSYYNGETDKVTIGLPHDDKKRHHLVKGKIIELLSGSLQYLFNDEDHRTAENDMRSSLQDLARVSFLACVSIGEVSFLFDEAYDWYSDYSVQDIFLYELEHYILQHKIDTVPTAIIKDISIWYATHDLGGRLENIFCALQTDTMDIDDVSTVCIRLGLYDALISVWNRALNDYVTPLIQIMSVAQNLEDDDDSRSIEREDRADLAMKLFTYMAYTLTGRRYPDGSDMAEHESLKPKASMYGFVFADKPVRLSQPRGTPGLQLSEHTAELNYPYLRSLLHFNAFHFMRMLNEVFEDSLLNGDHQQLSDDLDQGNLDNQPIDMSINRQRIVNILLEVVTAPEFDFEETICLDIFLARNLAKYAQSQFILLSGSSLRQILIELCNNPREDLHEECQLSIEYLLSTYRPPDLLDLVPLFSKAGYFRILKSTYRSSKQFANWLEAYFEDPEDKTSVFTSIGDCLRPNSGLSKRQIQEVKAIVAKHINDLAEIDVHRAGDCLQAYAPDMLGMALGCLDSGSRTKFNFLQAVFEPTSLTQSGNPSLVEAFRDAQRSFYVKLMCKHDTHHVAEYVGLLGAGDLDMDAVLPDMEENGAADAAVIVLTRNGLPQEAMRRLLAHLGTLQREVLEVLDGEDESRDVSIHEGAIGNTLDDVQKYVKVGIWLCQHASSNVGLSSGRSERVALPVGSDPESTLGPAEILWLDLIDGIVQISQAVSSKINAQSRLSSERDASGALSTRLTETLRQVVQQAFTGLLAITSRAQVEPDLGSSVAPAGPSSAGKGQPIRFLHVLRAFMARLSSRSSSISSVRTVIDTIFSAYLFESSMLDLANALLDKTTFVHVAEAEKNRRLGWRPRSQLCEGCKRRAWGASAGGATWEAWQRRRLSEDRAARRPSGYDHGHGFGPGHEVLDKGKGRDEGGHIDNEHEHEHGEGTGDEVEAIADGADGLYVFSCMHIFHRRCFERAAASGAPDDDAIPASSKQCPLCASG